MRVGKNPAKTGLPAYAPQKLGVALLTYIPFEDGYFANSLSILKYQIDSLYASTPQPFDLTVFDNGSCPAVTRALKELHEQKRIDWLILSRHNIGKAGAWNWLFSSLPNELICYADSDVLFRSGWLEASQAVLDAFPRAGMVSAQPNFFDVLDGQGKAHLAFAGDPRFEFGEYYPDPAIVEEYCLGIGADEALSARFRSHPLPSITHLEKAVRAVIGASHMQFIIPREVARQIAPLPASKALYREETISLDRRIDDLGYLHLSTQQNHVFHMGNTISERLLAEIGQLAGDAGPAPAKKIALKQSLLQRSLANLAQHPRGSQFLTRAYNLLFRVLYAER